MKLFAFGKVFRVIIYAVFVSLDGLSGLERRS